MHLAPVQIPRPRVRGVAFAPSEDPLWFFNQIFTLPLSPALTPLLLVRLVKLRELLIDVALIPRLVLQFSGQLFDTPAHMRGF